jgi:hypothetical protein
MYDISGFYNTEQFYTLPNDAYNLWDSSYWSYYDPSVYSQQMKSHNVTVYGKFYSIQQNGVLIPVWELTSIGSDADNSIATIYGQKVNSVPSTNGTYNVDWAEYKAWGGGASKIYSVDTVGGQPPSSVSSSLDLYLSCLVDVLLAVHAWQ